METTQLIDIDTVKLLSAKVVNLHRYEARWSGGESLSLHGGLIRREDVLHLLEDMMRDAKND